MKKIILFVCFVFIFSFISGACGEGQIDINSASLSELQEIFQIGQARAEQIINLRPFESVDDLVRVSGIAEDRLSKIKNENLACVSEKDEEDPKKDSQEVEEEVEKNSEEDNSEENEMENTKVEVSKKVMDEEETVIKETINLNTDVIKQESKEEKSKGIEKANIFKWGLIAFGLFMVFLLLIKGKKYENEFR